MFSFNGVHIDVYGRCTIAPLFKKSKLETQLHFIEGSDKTTRTELGFSGYVTTAQILLPPDTNIDDVHSWLNGGGRLVNDGSNKYVDAFVDDVIEPDFLTLGTYWKKLTVSFLVLDTFKHVDEADTIITVSPTIYTNVGTYFSNPKLTIEGSGEIEVSINGRSFQYDFLTDTEVTIDTTQKDAYLGAVLKNRQMTGDFPTLDIGSNSISWSGTITQITLTPNTRYL